MSVLRLEGLPFSATVEDVVEFFAEVDVKPEHTHLLLTRDLRPLGAGFVELSSESDAVTAREMDGQCISDTRRYVRIFKSDANELEWHLKRQKLTSFSQGCESLFCVRMYGLPFRVSEYEVAHWFKDADAECVDVQIHRNRDGRASGDATAYFASQEEAEKAMNMDKADMSGRYVNLSMDSVSATFNSSGRGSAYRLRMTGVPYRATEQELKDFFLPAAECQNVKVILNRNGRPSGDAVAEFESEEMLEKAMSKNRDHIGNRFVVLSMESSHGDGNRTSHHSAPEKGSRFTVKMGGLPYKATVYDIIDWFQPVAECIHARILRNRDNRPSGEAIAEFATEKDANAALSKNKDYMGDRFVVLKPSGFKPSEHGVEPGD